MDAGTQFGQPTRAAARKAVGRDASLWVKEFTSVYSDAITAGVDPQLLEQAFNHVADSIVGAQARQHLSAAQYEARHRRTAFHDKGVRPVIADAPGRAHFPDPKDITTPAAYMDGLRRFRLWAGNPSLRRMQLECGGRPSASTLCKALQGYELPSLEMVDAIIVGCGGRDEHRQAFASAWRRVAFSQQDENNKSPRSATIHKLYLT
jgi:hypothetical protein